MIDIYELLKSGDLLGVSMGSSERDISVALGKKAPEKINVGIDNLGPIALLYGGLEFHLFDDKVINIIIKMANYQTDASNIWIGSKENTINRKTTLNKMIKILNKNKIHWEFYSKYSSGKRIELITEGSTTIEFLAEKNRILINRIHRNDEDTFESHE